MPESEKSYHDFLDFIESDLIRGAVVQFCCPRGLVGGDLLGVLQEAAVAQVGRDPVARKVWQQTSAGRPATLARRLTIARTSRRSIRRPVSCLCRSMVRKRGVSGLVPNPALPEVCVYVLLGLVEAMNRTPPLSHLVTCHSGEAILIEPASVMPTAEPWISCDHRGPTVPAASSARPAREPSGEFRAWSRR